jgi:hypothetical protein
MVAACAAPTLLGPHRLQPRKAVSSSPQEEVKTTSTMVTVTPCGKVTPSKTNRHADGNCKLRGGVQKLSHLEDKLKRAKTPVYALIASRE